MGKVAGAEGEVCNGEREGDEGTENRLGEERLCDNKIFNDGELE